MSNQVILWGTLIVPWLTLFFMPRKDVKRYMSAGLLAAFMSIIVSEVGVANGWWFFRENIYPIAMMSAYTYGLFPIIPMWILKYTYRRLGLYLAVEVVVNTVFSSFVLPWFGSRGIIDFNAGLIAFILASIISIAVYGFQVWQEGIFVRSKRTRFSANLQPLVAKPLPNDEGRKDTE